jgi:hypothetical protein
VRVHHLDKDMDDPQLQEVLRQRPDGPNRGRRRRGAGETTVPPSVSPQPALGDRLIMREYGPLPPISLVESNSPTHDRPPHAPSPYSPHSLYGPDSPSRGTGHGIPPADEDAKLDRLGNAAGPFTDSGYASAAPRDSAQVLAASEDDNDDCDSRTIISMATTVLPNVAQHSISEVCNNMYNSIYRQVDEQNLEPFFEALPDLIKTFALRFAHLDPSNTNRRIMHFVYTRHRYEPNGPNLNPSPSS